MTPLPEARNGQDGPAAAFDRLATRYDDLWTNSVIGMLQRRQVTRLLYRTFKPGDFILELGCGTGEDAVCLSRSGARVHAVDTSAEMLLVARNKAERMGVSDRVSFELRPLEALGKLEQRGPYDGALSNFGAINCMRDLRALSKALAVLLRPEAPLVLCFIGRFCLLETVWFILCGRPAKAFRRLRSERRVSLAGGTASMKSERGPSFDVHYPSIKGLTAAFQEAFSLQSVRGVGILIPPSYFEHRARRHPGAMQAAARLDSRIGALPLLRGLGDHRLVVLRRRGRDARQGRAVASGPLLRCPACHSQIGLPYSAGSRCTSCAFILENRDGILRALIPERQAHYEQFLREYSAVRLAEGRGSPTEEYYRALPFRDLTGRNSSQWVIRARTFRYFVRRVLPGLGWDRPLDILDLGAGTGWFSYRLAKLGHSPVAVDLLVDGMDGLGAARHFWGDLPKPFPCIVAEFDNLPFCDSQIDLALFNASFHYSTDYRRTLEEICRCLRPAGGVVILDSPIYRCPEHGERMAEERHREFERRYGFRSDSIPSQEFLYDQQLADLAEALHLNWEVHRPWYGLAWHLRPWKARLKGARPPSRFNILVGRRPQ